MTWFGHRALPTPATRLSRDEAIRIAREAAGDDPLAATLGYAEPSIAGATIIWTVASVAFDEILTIIVDDATGSVLRRSRDTGLPRR